MPPNLQGFILTRNWRDTPAGTEIEYWLATDAGPLKVLLTVQTSVAFVETQFRAAVEAQLTALPGMQLRELELKTFHQKPVIGVYAKHFRQFGQLALKLQPQNIPLLEADVRHHDRYLMERFITAGVLVEGGRIEQSTILECKLKSEPSYRPVLKVVSLDIETSENAELYSIALDGMAERVVYMLGETPPEPEAFVAPAEPLKFALVYCPTRKAMIEQLNAWFERNDPDVLIGWNVIQFDLHVLQKTADQCGTPLLLGRERQPIAWRTHPGKQGYLFAPTPGPIIVDGIDALKAAVWSFPSFSLENVSQTLLGEGKSIGDEYVGEIQSKAYPGGYVMDSQPGFYDSVVVLDYKSLYPSIIRTYCVDPVGHAEGQHASDPAAQLKGPMGTLFSRHKHCLPEIVTTLSSSRDEAKRVKNEPLSQTLKLLMNSFAGVLGATECRFFNPELVSAVTLRGHEIVKRTQAFVENRGYDAIYGDTDSIFIWLGRTHTNDEAHAVAAELVRDINAWWMRTLRKEQDLDNYLEIEFDTHYKKFFMPTVRGSDVGSKKRYAGPSTDKAGKEEMVYRGLEMARSDWTPLARQFQDGLLSRIFHGEPYKEFVTEYARSTLAGHKDDLLIYRKRLRHRLDAYQVNVPPQVRAARIADAYNAKLHRPQQYQPGGWIQYVMTRNGPEPLESRQSRIDYEHYLSKQLMPIADAIHHPMGESFAALTSLQQGLF